MKEFSTADRLKQIITEREIRQVDILRLCQPYCKKFGVKLGKNDLSQYVNGKHIPNQDKLTILALALGVSETWLMGYDSTATKEDCAEWDKKINIKACEAESNLLKQIQEKFGLTTFQAVQLFIKLNDSDQGKVIERMETLLENPEYNIEKESSSGKAI